MTRRSDLRAVVFEIADQRCEWPGCPLPADELAHISPRGMGHRGSRDTVGNVMAACARHARITDMESPSGEPWTVVGEEWATIGPPPTGARRARLTGMVAERRRVAGFDV